MERWRAVPGFDGYEVSDRGACAARIAAPHRGCSSPPTTAGYRFVNLVRDGKHSGVKVHRLVLAASSGRRSCRRIISTA